jgi:hypothetical protein
VAVSSANGQIGVLWRPDVVDFSIRFGFLRLSPRAVVRLGGRPRRSGPWV